MMSSDDAESLFYLIEKYGLQELAVYIVKYYESLDETDPAE